MIIDVAGRENVFKLFNPIIMMELIDMVKNKLETLNKRLRQQQNMPKDNRTY